jgi:5-methylcytosine-specific restriction endonuclease McrA
MEGDMVPCPKCGVLVPLRLRPETPHYGDGLCPEHRHFWVRKPDNEKRPRRKSNLDLLQSIEAKQRTYCWRCLRSSSVLKGLRPPLGLEVHHVIEVTAGGTDDASNLQVLCAECHEETHRDRRRYGRYENNGEAKEACTEEEPGDWDF